MNASNDKWRDFLSHFGTYLIIITMLAVINILSGGENWWVQWPAMGWGVGLAFHLLDTILSSNSDADEADQMAQATEQPQAEKKQPQADSPIEQPTVARQMTNPTTLAHLDKAHAYKTQIAEMARQSSDPNSRARLADLLRQVDEWVTAVDELARRIDRFQQNDLIHQDLESVPQSIEDLKVRLAEETQADTQAELQRLLTNREHQLDSLERLQQMMRRAELQIESTLSSLGTIYSQLLTGQSTDHVADYSRLSANVDEEVRVLQDQLDALEEVKLGRSSG